MVVLFVNIYRLK